MKLDLVPLSELAPSPRNPKGHDLGGIHVSMDRFGWQGAIILRGDENVVVAGHGRTEVLAQKKARGESPPVGIKVAKDGDWLVPAIRGDFRTEKEAEAYLVADNRWVELGGWDEADLAALLADFAVEPDGLEGIGFDADDLDRMLAESPPEGFPSFDEDLETQNECPRCGYEF